MTAAKLLLSSKHISEFSSDAYAEYVRSLYVLPQVRVPKEKKVRIPKVKPVPKLTFSLTKKGRLSVKGKRKWVTEEEFRLAAASVGLRLRSMWLALREKTITVVREAPEDK